MVSSLARLSLAPLTLKLRFVCSIPFVITVSPTSTHIHNTRASSLFPLVPPFRRAVPGSGTLVRCSRSLVGFCAMLASSLHCPR